MKICPNCRKNTPAGRLCPRCTILEDLPRFVSHPAGRSLAEDALDAVLDELRQCEICATEIDSDSPESCCNRCARTRDALPEVLAEDTEARETLAALLGGGKR